MRILIADDFEDFRVFFQELATGLVPKGTEFVLAADGLEAKKEWERQRFDMVITDWQMPGLDGLELARHIRRREVSNCWEHVPILLCTAALVKPEAVYLPRLRVFAKTSIGEIRDAVQHYAEEATNAERSVQEGGRACGQTG